MTGHAYDMKESILGLSLNLYRVIYIYIKKSKNVPRMSLIDFMLVAHKKSSF